jgi:DnaJ homolog subfamily B member 4
VYGEEGLKAGPPPSTEGGAGFAGGFAINFPGGATFTFISSGGRKYEHCFKLTTFEICY